MVYCGVLLLILSYANLEQSPHIRLNRAADVEVTGLPDTTLKALSKLVDHSPKWFSLSVVRKDGKVSETPVLGTWKVEGEFLRFTPRFPFVPGVHYRAVFDPAGA